MFNSSNSQMYEKKSIVSSILSKACKKTFDAYEIVSFVYL